MIEQHVSQIRAGNKRYISGGAAPTKAQVGYQQTAERLVKRFGTPVAVKANEKGAGQIVIRFKSAQELARISKLLER